MELSETCDFKDKNEEIRDRLVIGILDKELSLELQLKADLTLENCVDRFRNSEMVKKQNEVAKGVDHASRGGRRGRFHKGFLFIVCFTSYFVFSIDVLPHSPGVVYCHQLLRRETRIPGVAPFSFRIGIWDLFVHRGQKSYTPTAFGKL